MKKSVHYYTITNHGVKESGAENGLSYGIPAGVFPEPEIGYQYRVVIEKRGADPRCKPELHAFIPRGQFGRLIHNARPKEIAQARLAIRKGGQEPVDWWRLRLKKLLIDRRNYRAAVKAHAAAVRKWRRDCK